ncbi:MAG: ATP-dependent DNA helicase [Gammaproteobacteria bacterium]|nr:ATP-dependent DNA helicase [Gammaproteobacteria bacterium]
MATAVSEAIRGGENLVVEAGTGTGKTLAYLIPALLSDRRVIVSTGTKTLQDQLFHRDLPNVCRAIGRAADTVLLKGRSNYLCLHRLETARFEEGTVPAELAAIESWAGVTRSGDVAEVEGLAEDAGIWPRVTSTVENCLGAQCDFYSRCHVVAARQAAMEADVIVVNHHLLLADMVLKEEGFGELLPGAEAVIVDEAHQFPDIAQAFFNRTMSSRHLQSLADDLRAEALREVPPARKANELADGLLKLIADTRIALPRSGTNLPWDDVAGGLDPCVDQLILLLDDMIDWLAAQNEELPGLRKCLERARAASARLESISGGDQSAGLRWVGLSRSGFVLNYTPVEVADSLRPLIESFSCAWVFTSATIAIGEDFSHFTASAGLDDPQTLSVPSPFDYPANSLLLLPQGLPEPNDGGYTGAVLKTLRPLLEAAGGRTFLLFTSHRALREAATLLREDDLGFPLLVQGEGPRSKLLQQFTELDNPVLLGAASFWEGVDIRGPDLVLVIIDKLPFASPGDPLLKARLEAVRQRGGNPFRDYQLPQAILGLKQGAGRLIRDFDDKGVVVVCDPRVSSRSYGRAFLGSLPPFTVTRDTAAATRFLLDC